MQFIIRLVGKHIEWQPGHLL